MKKKKMVSVSDVVDFSSKALTGGIDGTKLKELMLNISRSAFDSYLKEDAPENVREVFHDTMIAISLAAGLEVAANVLARDNFEDACSMLTRGAFGKVGNSVFESHLRREVGWIGSEFDDEVLRGAEHFGATPGKSEEMKLAVERVRHISEICTCPGCFLRAAYDVAPVVSRYRVDCPEHGWLPLCNDEYVRQMLDTERGWRCPVCDAPAEFDEGGDV